MSCSVASADGTIGILPQRAEPPAGQPPATAVPAQVQTGLYAGTVDIGGPVSYEVIEPGTPVYSSDGEQIGKVAHVMAVEDADLFEGIVIVEHMGAHGHRFVDEEDIAEFTSGACY
jgi:hypothetical protein